MTWCFWFLEGVFDVIGVYDLCFLCCEYGGYCGFFGVDVVC